MGFLAGWFGTNNNSYQYDALAESIKNQAPQQFQHDLDVHKSLQLTCITPKSNTLVENKILITKMGSHANHQQLKELTKIYFEQSEAFTQKLEGSFVLVLADFENKRLLLATDHIGQHNLYYAVTANGIVFGTTADAVIAHPEVSADISHQSIYDYVYFHHCPSPCTIYKQVQKLEGGQLLIYQEGKIELTYYWIPQFKETLPGSLAEASQDLKNKLTNAVKHYSTTAEETGAFLSGGLDSSSVAGALSLVYPGKARTFTMGFPVEGYDEIEYARIASAHFDTQANEYYLTPEDTVAAIPKIAAYYDEPFGNSSALAAYYCAKFAKEKGIKVLLAGDGGDELFAGNERYAKQLLFEQYYQLPGLARSMLRSGLYRAPDLLLKNKIIFKAKRYVEQAEIPLPDRLQDYNFLNRHPASEIFNSHFLETIDVEQPIKSLQDCYNRPQGISSLNRMLYMDWKTTLHDNDLVKVNKMCEMAGVEVCYPLLTKEMIDLSCQIPSAQKLKGQQLRWFYKEAMRNYLPDQIINKSKHGFGLPFGIWLKDHQPLKELAYDSINSLKKRDYLRSDFLDHAIKMHQSVHAAYYGELIWILMMLEQWFQEKKR